MQIRVICFALVLSIFSFQFINAESPRPEPAVNPATGTGESAYPPYLHSGEFAFTVADFSLRGRSLDYVFARTYESQTLYDGPMGFGWDHQYFARIQELPNGDVFYFDGMGRKELFRFQEQPGCESEDCNGYIPPAGQFVILKKQQDGQFLIVEHDGLFRLFNNYGQLARIQDRNDNALEFLRLPQPARAR